MPEHESWSPQRRQDARHWGAAAAVAAAKDYQVTGPVVDVKDDTIIVKKGSENWEIARDKDTKVTGELKAGAKVTEFSMPPEMFQMREAQKTLSAFDGPRAAADDVRRHDDLQQAEHDQQPVDPLVLPLEEENDLQIDQEPGEAQGLQFVLQEEQPL